VATLQAAADDLGARAALDPQAARAMDRLPSSITHRAMGGGSSLADVTAPLTSAASSADPAFGLLRDVLSLVERRLDQVRPGVERREALAAATPSIWPVAGWLSSTYGTRTDPFTGAPDFHAGLDISADHGQAVRATAAGSVAHAGHAGDFGNLVVIDHGFGIRTRYGHLSRFAVSPGQSIHKGDIVGYVGSTGRSTSPHVHYELLLNGRATNPLRLLGR
jgi:murein DD-endopeptidase MepM/ murein hydrolase activator NlpD